jgi:hypothetical protein
LIVSTGDWSDYIFANGKRIAKAGARQRLTHFRQQMLVTLRIPVKAISVPA